MTTKGSARSTATSPAHAEGQRLLCVSCDPGGAPPSADAHSTTSAPAPPLYVPARIIPNLTDDGSEVFFQSPDRLLPEDANAAAGRL